jgi:hypothetical protein
MKKIMMNKYGFERWAEEDFSDDGSRFYCYKVGKRVRVSKCTYKGKVFISARIDDIVLPCEVYSSLPSYRALDKLNGVNIDSLTDDDLFNLYETCIKYEQEYTDAENSIVMPTLEEITKHCKYIQNKVHVEIYSIEQLIKNNIATLLAKATEYQWKNIKYYYNNLVSQFNNYDETTYPQKIVGTSQSISLCKADYYAKKESYYYRQLVELISSVINGGK